MITYTNSRYDNMGLVGTINRVITVEQAMHMLIDGEFTFGARIHDIGCTCVRLTTGIFGNRDDIMFDGSEDEMALLIEVARYYRMMDSTATCRITSILHEFALGCTKAEAVTKMMIRSKCKEISLSYKCELKDLIAVMLLIRKDNVAPSEAVTLLN